MGCTKSRKRLTPDIEDENISNTASPFDIKKIKGIDSVVLSSLSPKKNVIHAMESGKALDSIVKQRKPKPNLE
jgi:hypothetical protein